jgi:hypothetical protein
MAGSVRRGPQRSYRPRSDRRRASCDPPLAEHGSGSISRRRQPDTQGRLSGPRSPCRVRRRRGSSSLPRDTPGSPRRMNSGRKSDRSAPERLSGDRVRRTGSRVARFGPTTPELADPILLRWYSGSPRGHDPASAPGMTSQILMVWSPPAKASRLPSGRNATAYTSPRWLGGSGVPGGTPDSRP